MLRATLFVLAVLTAGAASAQGTRTVPLVDHHQHLLSPASAARLVIEPPTPVVLPAEFAQLLKAREAAWNDKAGLAAIFTPDAAVLDDREHVWLKADKAVELVAGRFARPYQVTPIAFSQSSDDAYIAGYFSRGSGAELKHIGQALLLLRKTAGGWRIAAESQSFPGPGATDPIDAERLVTLLDQAGIKRAVVLSLAYWYGSPLDPPVPDELAKVRAENDWTAAQAARYPDRLVAFCSFNPLKDYALAELGRCTKDGRSKGLKLHLGNSGVDLKNPEHVVKLRTVFAAANARRVPIVVHMWTLDPAYGRPEAEAMLNQILPAAPDIVVQVAHMAGGGPGWTDEALEVFANAIQAKDPRTRNLYVDVATVADRQNHEQLQLMARRIRQIGPERILYGSDAAFAGNNPPDQEWGTFRGMVPLTDEEFRIIANNVAPYLR
ncbi:MAG TPA: amidohydrolase family protein [Caulobacteraceae bacterium]|jgi:predicted TIM-barrel fold metal-dependent hydrolase